ncbi:hypothetical protein PsorP6_012982 [Peronosclerospora sorghi]|uniref:Uncharacterized protein n=1 Tax=Peronosclerospora sorghi TaxID=230839 RepID=A0ACC0WFA9_9STRA|nr:hypothetical protein PsorP6_012982 [Peronosclerospora sorghi]
MKSRKLKHKQLDSLIEEFIAKDVQHCKTHEDLLATIQVQPAYLRQMYKLPPAWLDGTYCLHAVYRATRGMVLPATFTDPLEYLRAKFNVPTATPLQLFEYIFPDDEVRRAALSWAMVDLFLMVFAPGIYFDPVKVSMLIPAELPNKRLRTPFLLWSDINLQCVTKTDAVANRYLLLKTTLNDAPVYIHVVYAPDEPSERGEFFRALPTVFDDDSTLFDTQDYYDHHVQHLVMGDFNVTLDNHLDQKLPGLHHPGTGRTELRDWLVKLGLIDSWRFMNPDIRDFTIPKRKNRLDYCFLTPDLLQHRLDYIRHVRDMKWHNEDHIAVEFRLKAKILPRSKRQPWICPPWLLKDPMVKQFLVESAADLANRLKSFCGANPGCLLDEHKRSDCIYLRSLWIELKDLDERRTAQLVKAVNDAHDRFNTTSTDHHHEVLLQAQLQLKDHQEHMKARNQSRKFAADLYLSERATGHFFRAPQKDFFCSPITGFQYEDGVVTEDPALVAVGHRKFWGEIFQSTSTVLRHQHEESSFHQACSVIFEGCRPPSQYLQDYNHAFYSQDLPSQDLEYPYKILGVEDTVKLLGIFTSAHHGGLGLTPVKEFIQAMHLKSLGDAIAATVRRCAAPRWMTPALSLFSKALGTQGEGFDILYALVKGKWSFLTDFWFSTLHLWTDLNIARGSSKWKCYTQTAPFWNNFNLLFGKTKRPMVKLSKHNSLLQAHGLCRQQDFAERSSNYATQEYLYDILDVEAFPRPASKTLFIVQAIPRLTLLQSHDSPMFGPVLPSLIESARHGLILDNIMRSQEKQGPKLPLRQLDIPEFTPPDDMWTNEISWYRNVLPVAADVNFPIQRNAMGFRYKFQWRSQVETSSTCVHGCAALETAQHLFWHCPVAAFQWIYYLRPFESLLTSAFNWKHILFPRTFHLRPEPIRLFGERHIFEVFNITRCCVFRSLSLHRNKRIYDPTVSTDAHFVRHHCFSYVDPQSRQLRLRAEENCRRGLVRFLQLVQTSFATPTVDRQL